jgi:5-methylcytosine-specific restriction endonuclease McrA
MGFETIEEKRAYQLAWLKARRERAITMLGGQCAQCSSTNELQFDHIDPDTKDPLLRGKTSNKGFPFSWAWTRIEVELAKCQLLCTQCHIAKTRNDFEPSHGTNSRYTGRRCRCQECRMAHAKVNAKYR